MAAEIVYFKDVCVCNVPIPRMTEFIIGRHRPNKNNNIEWNHSHHRVLLHFSCRLE